MDIPPEYQAVESICQQLNYLCNLSVAERRQLLQEEQIRPYTLKNTAAAAILESLKLWNRFNRSRGND